MQINRWTLASTLLMLTIFLPVAPGCSTTRRITNTPLTALQQLLGTEAVDHAVAKLTWPAIENQRVFVQTASPGAKKDQAYLRQAVAANLAERGATVVKDFSDADYVVTVLAGSIGTDQKDVFFGIPAIQSVILPFALPEIALYKAQEQEGFAKTEVVTTDAKHGGVVHRSGPTRGRTYARTRTVLFVGWYRTDTSRNQ